MKGFVSVRVAVFFENFGPYHVARLNASSQTCKVLGLEWRGRSKTYAWEPVGGAVRFEKRTLLGSEVTRCSNHDLLRLLENKLDPASLDAVAVNGWGDFGSLAVISWALTCGIPIVVMSESTVWDETRVAWKEWVKGRIVGLCSAALVGGNPHADYLLDLGMPRERIFLGYDAVDNDYFEEKAEEIRKQPGEVASPLEYGKDSTGQGLHGPGKVESRNKYGLPEKYFLASARFVEKKNLPRLIEAYARYRELATKAENRKQPVEVASPLEYGKDSTGQGRLHGPGKAESVGENVEIGKQPVEVASQRLHGPGKVENTSPQPSPQGGEGAAPWDLVLLGDGPLRSTLNAQLSTLNLHDHVQMPGFKQYGELPVYYGLAKAFIHASTTEQWGLVVNEAMASGLPVLVSNRCGCATDLVKDGVNGFTFDPQNIEQLAQLMFQISLRGVGPSGPEAAFQPFRLSAFGDTSRQIIAGWGPERFANGLHDAVEMALKNPRPRAGLFDRSLLKALIYK